MKVLELDGGEPDMEENKVAQKLAEAIPAGHAYCTRETIADFILQSPDLRVEIVEPKYKVWSSDGDWEVSGGKFTPKWGAKFQIKEYADEYCAWLNSKEPK
jgi:hypothetical protein